MEVWGASLRIVDARAVPTETHEIQNFRVWETLRSLTYLAGSGQRAVSVTPKAYPSIVSTPDSDTQRNQFMNMLPLDFESGAEAIDV